MHHVKKHIPILSPLFAVGNSQVSAHFWWGALNEAGVRYFYSAHSVSAHGQTAASTKGTGRRVGENNYFSLFLSIYFKRTAFSKVLECLSLIDPLQN